MTEKELKSLPSFMAEDGSRKYIQEVDGDVFTLDKYGRTLRYESIVGDVFVYFYDDENHTVTNIDIWPENYSFHKHIFRMSKHDRIEYRLKELQGETVSWEDAPDYYERELLANETEQIQAQVDEIRERYPNEYLEPEEYFSELGIH